jgi:arylformamidase
MEVLIIMTTNSNKTGPNWIDVSVPLRNGMVVWPGDIEVEIEQSHSMQRGDAVNNSSIRMGAHTGTHMDAPLHFIAKGKSIDQLPFDVSIGPARVIEITDKVSIKLLADVGVRLIGIDYLSVGSQLDSDKSTPDTHQILLGAEIWLIEGMNLSAISSGNYNLICLPLKLMNSEGSPVRVILQPVHQVKMSNRMW